jgi:hypothetical protein
MLTTPTDSGDSAVSLTPDFFLKDCACDGGPCDYFELRNQTQCDGASVGQCECRCGGAAAGCRPALQLCWGERAAYGRWVNAFSFPLRGG